MLASTKQYRILGNSLELFLLLKEVMFLMDWVQGGYSPLCRCCLKRSEVFPNTPCVMETCYTSTALDNDNLFQFKNINVLTIQTCMH